MKKEKISFVIPCYKSELTIEKVYTGIKNTMDNSEYDYEIIFVNDGSPDKTMDKLQSIALSDRKVVAVNLSRNFGQHSALMAGYSQVTGDYVLGMDDDGEHNPKDLFKLLNKLKEGYDYVCAKFPDDNRTLYKKIGSKINNYIATKLIGKPKNAIFSSYYVMRRFVVDQVLNLPNKHPYVGGMIVAVTQSLSSVEIERNKRYAGTSSYHFRNSFNLLFNGITSYSIVPLQISTYIGILSSVIGFLIGIVAVVRKLIHPEILAGYTSYLATLLIIGGILMLQIGMVGEYVGRTYILENKLPQYVIRNIVRKEQDEQ